MDARAQENCSILHTYVFLLESEIQILPDLRTDVAPLI
jgi:hypothetical protein